ncbi:MAG: PAS domain S-box protein, partial [Pseudomonadota bacterium]
LILIYLILSAGIIATGYLYYRNYEKNARIGVEHQLTAIADLKAADIVQWRRERLREALTIFKNPAFTILVKRWFEHPDDAEAQALLQAWMGSLRESFNYDRIRLHDPQLIPRMTIPSGLPPLTSIVAQRSSEAMRSGQVILQDFYRNAYDQRIYLNVIVPIIDVQDNNRVLGFLLLRIDPEQYLYPLINHWPTPSRTAETLLVRRDGNDALFLNELRFKKNTALNLRIPLTSVQTPAVKAVLLQEGIFEGIDYRGVPVVADVRAISDSPWFMVARMDVAEVYAPMKEALRLIIFIIGALLLGAGIGVAFLWRQQTTFFFREQYKASEKLRDSQERFKVMYEQAPLGIALIDSLTGHVYEANPMFVKIADRPLKELLTLDWMSITHPDDVKEAVDTMALMNAGKIPGFQMNKRYLRPDGSAVWISMTIAPLTVEDKARPRHLCMIEDITKRKQTEEELLRSNSELMQFAYIASHDLQEPLRKVMSFGDRIKIKYAAALDDKGRDYLERMQNAAGRMRRLVDDLLKLSQVMTR